MENQFEILTAPKPRTKFHLVSMTTSACGVGAFLISTQMGYKDDIKTGQWQRKRLEIFNRDNFKCRICNNSDNITVHHLYYLPNTKIYEYENEGLVTVCQKHHDILNLELPKLSGIIAFNILSGKIDISNFIDYKNINDGRMD